MCGVRVALWVVGGDPYRERNMLFRELSPLFFHSFFGGIERRNIRNAVPARLFSQPVFRPPHETGLAVQLAASMHQGERSDEGPLLRDAPIRSL